MCDSVPDVQVKRNAKKQVRSGKDRAKRPCSLAAKPECLPSALLQNSKKHAQQIGATLGWFLLRHLQRVRVAFDGDFLLAIALTTLAAMLASVLPARNAARIDPVEAIGQ